MFLLTLLITKVREYSCNLMSNLGPQGSDTTRDCLRLTRPVDNQSISDQCAISPV
jgi:hypothetical protein